MKYGIAPPPAIVLIAFNRPASLKRLLNSVKRAFYSNYKVPLCICIDYQDCSKNQEVVRIAKDFDWTIGPKRVIHQSENLGLKKHVLACGDLTEHFRSIIMLEDDIVVSPAFYDYAVQALNFYAQDDKIGGISLYNHRMNFSNRVPFQPVEDGSDIYFLQVAASWGQAWTRNQWTQFRHWLKDNPVISASAAIPRYVYGWPDKSWLKHFITYLVNNERYFVYPRVSVSTNFGDAGENTVKSVSFYQVPLLLQQKTFTFKKIEDSLAKYDAYFDLQPSIIAKQNEELKNIDFANNLSGLKNTAGLDVEWVLMHGYSKAAIKSYGLNMKPVEANVFFGVPGKSISLVHKLETASVNLSYYARKKMYDYKYGIVTPKEKVQNVMDTLLTKVLNSK